MAQLTTKANSLLAIAFLLILAVILLLYTRLNSDLDTAQYWVEHTNEVLIHVKDLDIALSNAEAGQRGYLITGKDTFLAPYNAGRDRIGLLFGELKSLTSDNPAQQDRLTQIAPLLQQRLELLAQNIERRRTADNDAALADAMDRGRELNTKIRDLLNGMTATEENLLAGRIADANALRRNTAMLVMFGGGIAVILILFGSAMLRSAVRQREATRAVALLAAERTKIAFDCLSQGIAVFDANWRLVIWNECFVELLQLPADLLHADAPYGALLHHFGSEETFLETEAQIRERGEQRSRREPIVYERQRPDGRVFELRRTAMPAGGFAITISDITAKVRADEMQRASQRLQALGELTGGVAHDFNNLLTVISGNLEMMQPRLAANSELAPYVAAAMRGVDRGTTLTRHLLAFGRRQPLDPKPIDINRLVSEITSGMLRRTLGERIEIRVIETPGLWPAFADPGQVENALLNLALNARDAMPEGGKLTIETGGVTLDERYAAMNDEVTSGQYVMIAVSDTGVGMKPEVAARAFEPFFTTKPDGRGSGLGLAMVHGFAKQSKGHVKIYSELGHGTSVKLYLPRSLRAIVEEPIAPAVLPTGSATILVTEDDSDVRRVTAAQLRELGYEVFDAADAESALKIFSTERHIDLLLTDVVLPGRLRGRELANLISRASPRTRVLFMSGYTENAIVHDGKLDEGTLLLMKPFRREDLAKKVALALSIGRDRANGAGDGIDAQHPLA